MCKVFCRLMAYWQRHLHYFALTSIRSAWLIFFFFTNGFSRSFIFFLHFRTLDSPLFSCCCCCIENHTFHGLYTWEFLYILWEWNSLSNMNCDHSVITHTLSPAFYFNFFIYIDTTCDKVIKYITYKYTICLSYGAHIHPFIWQLKMEVYKDFQVAFASVKNIKASNGD